MPLKNAVKRTGLGVRRVRPMEQDRELEEEWEKIKSILEKIPPEEVTRSIREDRDSR